MTGLDRRIPKADHRSQTREIVDSTLAASYLLSTRPGDDVDEI